MTRLVSVLMLCLASALAVAGERYIVLAAKTDIGSADRNKILAKIRLVVSDIEDVNIASTPKWRISADTSSVWRVISIDATKDGSILPKLNITRAQFEAWKDANLDSPNKLQVRAGDDPEAALRAAGLEPVPVEREGP